jgi:hypothetical protein
LNAQVDTLTDFQLPKKAEWVDIQLMSSDDILGGYLYQASPAKLSIIKHAETPPNSFKVIEIPPSNLKRVKFSNQVRRDPVTGAAIGIGVGMLTGILWASAVEVPNCDPVWFSCTNSEERQEARRKKVSRFLGSTAIGTALGAAIGTNVKLTLPLYGNRYKYESELQKIKELTILK